MRLRIETKIISDFLGFDYQSLSLSLIKYCLSNEDISYFNELYPKEGMQKPKAFTFASNITNFSVEGSGVNAKITGDNLIINISTIDFKLAIILYNAIFKMKNKEYTFKDMTIKIIGIARTKEFQIDSDVVEFRTLSPIYLKEKNNRKDYSVDIDDMCKYVEILNYISNVSLNEVRGYGLKQKLEFMPLNYKKIISQQRYSSQSDKSKSLCKSVYKGNFILRGNIDDLRDLYKIGLGFSRGVGFGNIEVIRCL